MQLVAVALGLVVFPCDRDLPGFVLPRPVDVGGSDVRELVSELWRFVGRRVAGRKQRKFIELHIRKN